MNSIVNWVELRWGSRMGPNYARLFVGYVASKRYIDDIAWWGQLCAGGINSRTLLTLFLTSTQHFNSHELLPKQNYRFSISTCAFLKIEFEPRFSTRKRILTTTSISPLFIIFLSLQACYPLQPVPPPSSTLLRRR